MNKLPYRFVGKTPPEGFKVDLDLAELLKAINSIKPSTTPTPIPSSIANVYHYGTDDTGYQTVNPGDSYVLFDETITISVDHYALILSKVRIQPDSDMNSEFNYKLYDKLNAGDYTEFAQVLDSNEPILVQTSNFTQFNHSSYDYYQLVVGTHKIKMTVTNTGNIQSAALWLFTGRGTDLTIVEFNF